MAALGAFVVGLLGSMRIGLLVLVTVSMQCMNDFLLLKPVYAIVILAGTAKYPSISLVGAKCCNRE